MAQPLFVSSAIGNVMILVDCKRSTLGGEVGGAGWGLALMPRTATPRRLRSRKRLQTNKPKPIKTKNGQLESYPFLAVRRGLEWR